MSIRRKTAIAAGMVVMLALAGPLAKAAVHNNDMRIKVVSAETHTSDLGGNDVPKNCDGLNYDAYCNSSRTTLITNTMVVEEDNGKQLRVSCTVDSKFSRCVLLPDGSTFDARREKKGITIYYVDEKGKARSQLYTFVTGEAQGTVLPQTPVAAATPAPKATATPGASKPVEDADAGEYSSSRPLVKCSFTSTPAGAEVIVDGKFVGSTPSSVGVKTGSHEVVISMAGFALWRRELDVSEDSDLTVNAVLQKVQ